MEESEEEPTEVMSPDDTLLHCARRNQVSVVTDLIKSSKEGKVKLDINCKGTRKFNRGWSPLHLAAYFGHKDVVKLLLENGANVDILNMTGDTPLHRAAYTGRVDCVMLLLQANADICVKNSEGQTAKDMAKTKEIRQLLEAAEQHEQMKREEDFLASARMGDMTKVHELVSGTKVISVNCRDEFGNTALHLAAQTEQREMAVLLLQKGIDSNVKNKSGQNAMEVATSQQMKQLLGVKPVKDFSRTPQRYEGSLLKKTIIGSKLLWVVLERGVLSYFKNRGDASTGVKRRGMKYLDEARIFLEAENNHDFIIYFSDGSSHKLGIDPDTGIAVSRQRWLNALRDHIGFSTHFTHQGELPDEGSEEIVPVHSLQEAFQKVTELCAGMEIELLRIYCSSTKTQTRNMAQAHQTLLQNQVLQLSNWITSVKEEDKQSGMGQKVSSELQQIVESSRDTCNSLNSCLSLFTQQEELRQVKLKAEEEKSRVLQEALHALALEHHQLEKSYSCHRCARMQYNTDDDDYYECDEDQAGSFFHRPSSPGSQSVRSDMFMDAQSVQSFIMDGLMGKDKEDCCSLMDFSLNLGGR